MAAGESDSLGSLPRPRLCNGGHTARLRHATAGRGDMYSNATLSRESQESLVARENVPRKRKVNVLTPLPPRGVLSSPRLLRLFLSRPSSYPPFSTVSSIDSLSLSFSNSRWPPRRRRIELEVRSSFHANVELYIVVQRG